MKTEYVALSVAFVAAAASLAGVFYNQYGTRVLEREKWQQAQEDALQSIVVNFAKELSSAHQRAEWIVWKANHTPKDMSQKDFDEFDSEAKSSLPNIFGYRVLLNAKRPTSYAALDEMVKGYFAADACVGVAGAEFRSNRDEGIRSLSACGKIVMNVTDAMASSFGKAMNAASPANNGVR